MHSYILNCFQATRLDKSILCQFTQVCWKYLYIDLAAASSVQRSVTQGQIPTEVIVQQGHLIPGPSGVHKKSIQHSLNIYKFEPFTVCKVWKPFEQFDLELFRATNSDESIIFQVPQFWLKIFLFRFNNTFQCTKTSYSRSNTHWWSSYTRPCRCSRDRNSNYLNISIAANPATSCGDILNFRRIRQFVNRIPHSEIFTRFPFFFLLKYSLCTSQIM